MSSRIRQQDWMKTSRFPFQFDRLGKASREFQGDEYAIRTVSGIAHGVGC